MNIKEVLNEIFYDGDKKENIENRTPEKWSELIDILVKEHEETFKNITLEAHLINL